MELPSKEKVMFAPIVAKDLTLLETNRLYHYMKKVLGAHLINIRQSETILNKYNFGYIKYDELLRHPYVITNVTATNYQFIMSEIVDLRFVCNNRSNVDLETLNQLSKFNIYLVKYQDVIDGKVY